jgi:hypothetical protein
MQSVDERDSSLSPVTPDRRAALGPRAYPGGMTVNMPDDVADEEKEEGQ